MCILKRFWVLLWSQTAKTMRSTLIRYRSDSEVSDRLSYRRWSDGLCCLGYVFILYWKFLWWERANTMQNTVECRYNAVQYCKLLHNWLQELRQNIDQILDPQKTPHTSPSRVSYGVSFVNICEKIDRVYNGTALLMYSLYQQIKQQHNPSETKRQQELNEHHINFECTFLKL